MTRLKLHALLLPVVISLLGACSKPSVFQEVIDQGATRFFGKAHIQSQSSDGNVTGYTFSTASGPMCLTGDTFTASVRDTGSDGLFIFLQGGGACWSDFCLAVTAAPAGIAQADILNPSLATNPLKDWSTVYLPYCDGSLFVGDSDWSSTGTGTIDRHQHGLQNLSAALDVAFQRFPNPKRIVLAGSSGGGYGTILAAILVRARYPDRPLFVFSDSGVGLGKPGDQQFMETILQQFNATSLIPKSCSNCISDGHITPMVGWELGRDPQLEVSVFSSYQDYVISQIYLQIPATDFQSALLSESDAVHQQYPDRYKRFFIDGQMHTTLLGGTDGAIGLIGDDPTNVILPPNFLNEDLSDIQLGGIDTTVVNGVSIATWFGAMINGNSTWTDTLQPMSQ